MGIKTSESNLQNEQPSENPGQMPILLENHTPEIRYIVGSQLKGGDLVLPTKEPEQDESKDVSIAATGVTKEKNNEDNNEIKQNAPSPIDENFDNSEPLSTSSPRKNIDVESPPKEILDTDTPVIEELDNEDSEKSLNDSKLPSKLANIEKIIPESDDSEPDKSDSDTSSSSDQPSSDSEWESFPDKKKEPAIKPQPEEITIDDDDDENVNDKSDASKYHDAFQSFLSKSKEEETESEIEEDPMERKRRTRQTSKLKQKQKEKEKEKKPIVITSDPADDEVIIYDPLEEELKQKQIESLDLKDVKLSDEDSSNDEMVGRTGSIDWDKNQTRSEKNTLPKRSRKRLPSTSKAMEEEIPEEETPTKPKDDLKSSKSQTNKVSMVAAIFRAKKKKQEEEKIIEEKKEDVDQKLKSIATRVLLPKGTKKGDNPESENEKEKEREKASTDKQEDIKPSKQRQDGAGEEKEMIPVDKLTIPEELCKIKSTGRGRGTNKTFLCQICNEQFDKADKIKHHLYNEHYDDYIRCSDSGPDILTKSYPPIRADNKAPPPLGDNLAEEKAPVISKPSALARIFKRKGAKKAPKPKEKTNVIKDTKESSEEDIQKSVFDFEEIYTKGKPKANISTSPVLSPKSVESIDNLVVTKVETVTEVKTPKTFDSLKSAQVDIEPLRVETKLGRRNSRSPRGARISEEVIISPVGGKSPEGISEEKIILTPASMKLLSPGNHSMNSSVILAQKTSFSSSELSTVNMTLSKPPENIQLSPRVESVKSELPQPESKSMIEEQLDKLDTKGPFISKPVSLKPRDEDSNINFEPKFGSHKNLVTFADLAMKSKAQAAKALSVKPKGRPGRKPKKVGRKKVSARISLEQSEIEDTPCLLALQASRDTDMLDEESSAIIEETQQSYKKESKEIAED